MRNNQAPSPLLLRTDVLHVTEVFLTVQGEGPRVGRPAVFARLAGCNLQCPMCDTRYPRNGEMTPRGLLQRCIDEKGDTPCDLIVLTGGEPLRQHAAGLFAEAIAKHASFDVQVETNGTLWTEGMEHAEIVVSPKENFVHPEIRKRAVAWKYPLHYKHVDPDDGLPTVSLANKLASGLRVARPPDWIKPSAIYLQPADAGSERVNRLNTEACVRSCLRYGYTMGLQTHKVIGVP